jgi:hypothetical protein
MTACDTIADLMQKMILVDEFVADKMKLIESNVNAMFTGIKFSLFERNQNGIVFPSSPSKGGSLKNRAEFNS